MRGSTIALAAGALALCGALATLADDATDGSLVTVDTPSAGEAVPASQPTEWEIVPAPTDGTPFPSASVLSEDGFRLYLWSRSDERGRQVFAELHAAEDTRFIGRMPTYVIDDEPMVDTADVSEAGDALGLLWGFTADYVSIWMIWLGQGDIPASDPAFDWFDAETLDVTIRMANGEDRTIRFPMAGARSVIEEAVEIRPQVASGS